VSTDDAQTFRDVGHFLRELLTHADVLPAGLTVLLRDYQCELRNAPPWRSNGIGDPCQYERLADRMALALTDGEWDGGEPLDDPARNWYAQVHAPRNFERALRLLAARGEIVKTGGRYYARPRDAGS
jgi:hypothetical protein